MPRQPHVIVFLTDQQRYDTAGVHGCPLDLTPNFDAAAAQGTHVAHSITCQPVCAAARGCLQTGQYATVNGVWSNRQHLAPGATGIANLFRDAGYTTAYFGKWHLAPPGASAKHPQAVPPDCRAGYDHWLGANIFEFCSAPYRCVLYDENEDEVVSPGYRADAVVDAAIRFLADHERQRPGTPLFMMVALIEPHHQNELYDYVPPHGYRERYAGRWCPPDLATLDGNAAQHLGGYFGCVKRCDEAFGRLRDAVESLGLSPHTNLLYTSDHGCHFNTRFGIDKRSYHEASVRVPTALVGPAFDGGGRIDQPVSLIDLPPTLLGAADIPVPDHYHGSPIQRLIWQPASTRPAGEAFIQVSEVHLCRAVRTDRWKYALLCPEGGHGDGTAPYYHEAALHDLHHDPYELTNLIHDEPHRATRDALRETLLARMAAIGEPAPEIRPPLDPPQSPGARY